MWDDHYGKQANPYGVDEFKLILRTLKAAPNADAPEMRALIKSTHHALAVESDQRDLHFDYDIRHEVESHAAHITDYVAGTILAASAAEDFDKAIELLLGCWDDAPSCVREIRDKWNDYKRVAE